MQAEAWWWSRRQLLRRIRDIVLGLLMWPREVSAQERARAIHEATRNTLAGAVGVRLRQLVGGRPGVYKPYRGAPRVGLPAPAPGPGRSLVDSLRGYRPAMSFDDSALSLALLTRLLECANGVTGSMGEIALRAAPSAGALYAGEVYVMAERVRGLAAGLYYYAPLSRDLVRLRKGAQLEELADALESRARARGAAAAMLLTNVFPRYRWRYANRGYRYALLDSGHIGENLRLAATSVGIAHWGPLRFEDDRLNRLLEIDGLDEAVCAVHLVGGRGADSRASATTRPLVEAAVAGHALPDAADDAPDRYHAATKLVPASGSPGRPTPPRVAASHGNAARIRLTPRADPGQAVEEAIRRRRSARSFRPVPVSSEDLAFAVVAVLGDGGLDPALELRLFVNRAVGVEPGLYRASAASKTLVSLRAGDFSEQLVAACLGQDKAGRAAVAFALVGDLEAAARRGGDRSYRDLCLAAGAAAERLYLAAEAVGLAARNLAAFIDERLNDLAALDGRRRAVLHLTVFGPGD